jgi:hypothetical protein
MSIPVAILVIVAATGLAAGLMLLLRRRAPEGGAFADSDRASSVFGLVGAGFAIFLGFVVFLAFDSYDEAKLAAETEAVAVLEQFEETRLFKNGDRAAVQGDLVCYSRAVINDEWKTMEDGELSPAVDDWTLETEHAIERLDVEGEKESQAFGDFLDNTDARENARRTRLLESQHPLPPLLWLMLGVAGLLVISYILLYADPGERKRAQAMMAGAAAAIISASILVVWFLDSPYGDTPGSIEPTSMEHTLELIEQELPPNVTLPCDERGTKL